MAFQWEQFKGGPNKPARDDMRVTIGPKGHLFLNRRAYRELGEPPAVLLLFERIESVIGLVPATPDNKEAFPFQLKSNSVYQLAGAPFFRHFGIRVRGTERFDEPYVDSEGIFRLDLRRTHSVAKASIGAVTPSVGQSGTTA